MGWHEPKAYSPASMAVLFVSMATSAPRRCLAILRQHAFGSSGCPHQVEHLRDVEHNSGSHGGYTAFLIREDGAS